MSKRIGGPRSVNDAAITTDMWVFLEFLFGYFYDA